MASLIFTARCYYCSAAVSCPLTACNLCPLIRACHVEGVWSGWDTYTFTQSQRCSSSWAQHIDWREVILRDPSTISYFIILNAGFPPAKLFSRGIKLPGSWWSFPRYHLVSRWQGKHTVIDPVIKYMTFVKWQQCYICYKNVVIFYMQRGPNSTIINNTRNLKKTNKTAAFSIWKHSKWKPVRSEI